MEKKGMAIFVAVLMCPALMGLPGNGYAKQALYPTQSFTAQQPQVAQAPPLNPRQQHVGLLVIADLSVSPLSYTGKCPARFTFTGKITVNRSTSVQYKFIRTDSFQTEPMPLTFEGPGTQEVTHTWQIGDTVSPPTFGESVAMELVYPVNRKFRSNTVIIRGSCTDQK